MVYFRKPGAYRNRRRYPHGGRKRRIGRGIRQLQSLSKDVQQLSQFVNTEFKYYDVQQEGAPEPATIPQATADSPARLFFTLNNIPQGTQVSQREGNSIKIKSLQHKCVMTNPSDVAVRVRCIWYLYLRPGPESDNVAIGDLLQLGTSSTVKPIIAPRNLGNRSRFVILKDTTYRLEPQGMVGEQKVIKWFKRWSRGFHTVWYDNGTEITKNLLGCMYFCDNDATSVTTPVMECYNRIRYIDN